MKKFLVLVTVVSFLISNIAYALPPEISAKSAIVIDAGTGRILYEKNINEKLPMASTTKIMTAIVALENANLTDIIKISPRAAHVEGSSIWLEENETITMENALYGLLLNSGNDAAIAISEHVGGSVEVFTEMMNKTARNIGAQNTNFKNPHGLYHKEHYTTAYDLALITRYALKNPIFAKIVKTKTKQIPWEGHKWNRLLKNHNKLLWMYEYADGVKTGFTKKSGRCLVSSATKNRWQIIAVTLNARDDWNDHINMLEYVFNNYELKTVIEKNQFAKTIAVKNGTKDRVVLVAEDSINVPLHKLKDEESKIRIEYNVPDYINAPVIQNQKVGKIKVYIDNKEIGYTWLNPVEYIQDINIIQDMKKIFKNWMLIFSKNNKPIL